MATSRARWSRRRRRSKAEKAGFKVLLTTSDYIPRLGGPIWTLQPYRREESRHGQGIHRAIAKAIMYIRNNKEGTMPVFKKYLGIDDAAGSRACCGTSCTTPSTRAMPKDLFREIFESRRARHDRRRPMAQGQAAARSRGIRRPASSSTRRSRRCITCRSAKREGTAPNGDGGYSPPGVLRPPAARAAAPAASPAPSSRATAP